MSMPCTRTFYAFRKEVTGCRELLVYVLSL